MAERKLQVNLISKPENILKTVYTACRTCYGAKLPIEVYDEAPDNEKMLTLIKRVISSGHFSTIEHIQLSFENPVLGCAIVCGVGSIISQIGDLAASGIKRDHEIKDYGKLIPGHGGILDRFDSVIFVAPAIYFLCMFI